ncbi:hypothetical protein KUL25_20745 [Rhodobacteraceae bacterium N5(2021)]|uniref:Uncharacterized protein n=1 Tax=Gymnodinialimonas phycosphaerae TaxID=2841589 RepID=A0A975U0M2_9RHOB|nr:hypothetical protein [Gymnodinialimonas phycosphaerae]
MGPSGLILLIMLVLIVVPFWKILPRAGIASWVALFAILPFVPFVLLWVLALKKWPGDEA